MLIDAAKEEQVHREAAQQLLEEQNDLESESLGNSLVYKATDTLQLVDWLRIISVMTVRAEVPMDSLDLQRATIQSLYKLVCPMCPFPFSPFSIRNSIVMVCEHECEIEPIEEAFARSGGEGNIGSLVKMLGDPVAPQPIRMLIHAMRRLRSAYALFDEDGEGGVDADEFGNTLTKLFQWRPTKFIMEKLLKVAVCCMTSVLCLTMLCLAVLCRTVLCLTMLCLTVLCRTVLCLTMLCLTVLCRTVLCLTVLCRISCC